MFTHLKVSSKLGKIKKDFFLLCQAIVIIVFSVPVLSYQVANLCLVTWKSHLTLRRREFKKKFLQAHNTFSELKITCYSENISCITRTQYHSNISKYLKYLLYYA